MNETRVIREVKLIAIGKSKGIRIPNAVLDKYGWDDMLVLEEHDEGVVLRSKDAPKMSWEDTARAMAAESEDWSAWDVTVGDGID